MAAMLLDCCGASVPELTANRDAESEAILSGMPSFFIASHTAPFFLERFKRKSMEPGRRCLAAVLAMLSLRIARNPPWSSASSDASTLLFSVSATKMSSAEDLRSDLPVRRFEHAGIAGRVDMVSHEQDGIKDGCLGRLVPLLPKEVEERFGDPVEVVRIHTQLDRPPGRCGQDNRYLLPFVHCLAFLEDTWSAKWSASRCRRSGLEAPSHRA